MKIYFVYFLKNIFLFFLNYINSYNLNNLYRNCFLIYEIGLLKCKVVFFYLFVWLKGVCNSNIRFNDL